MRLTNSTNNPDNPDNYNNPDNKVRKVKYIIIVEGNNYITYAYSQKSALSNISKRYADDIGEDVALVRWKMNNNKIDYGFEEYVDGKF